jgi:hypothetical protein
MLFRKLRHRHAAGDRQSIRVIGDGAIIVAARDRGFDNLFQRLAAVTPD